MLALSARAVLWRAPEGIHKNYHFALHTLPQWFISFLEINEDKLPDNHKLLLIWIFLAIIHCSSIKLVSRSISAIWRIMLGLCVSPEAAIELISCLYSLCDCSGELLCWPCGETAGFPLQLGSTSTCCLSGWAVNKQPVTWRSQQNAWLTRWLKWLQTLIHFTASYELESATWVFPPVVWS